MIPWHLHLEAAEIDATHCHWGEVTRHVGHSHGPAGHVSPRAMSQSHCLGIVVTPVTGAGAKSRHTGASVGGSPWPHEPEPETQEPERRDRERERGLCGPGLLHYTPASSSCSSVHFAPNNVAKVSSEPDPDRPQLPGPGNHLRLSGIACIILATVAPWSINQKWQEMVNVAFVAEENRNTCQCLM